MSAFAVWVGWRLLWSVLLVFTASDQLRGLTNWSNKWMFRDTPYLTSTAPRFSSFVSTLSKIKSVYISSSCCCCHLSLFLSTWISSFPRLQAWQPQARQPWPTENRFPPKSSPPSPHYLSSEESCAIIWLPSLSPSNPQYVFLSLAPGVNCWLWVYSKVIICETGSAHVDIKAWIFSPKNIKMPTKLNYQQDLSYWKILALWMSFMFMTLQEIFSPARYFKI